MFAWSESDLNCEQSTAVLDENNILLIACPGSGKTRTLTYKIAYELSSLDNKHKYVIAITYTNRAANEIKERIELLGENTKQLWIGTIHSFCLEWILRPYSLYLGELKKGFSVIDSHESQEILTTICNEYNSENNLKAYRNKITYWDCQYIFVDESNYTIISQDTSKHKHVERVLERYFNFLEGNHKIDYEHILFYALLLIKEHPIISTSLSNLFSYVLVDEYQDTKEIQYKIIGSIFSNSTSDIRLFIVGDPNQAIYQTMGGYAIEKKKLENLTGLSIKELELSKNYRSSEKLVEYFDYFKTYDNTIIASGKLKDHDSIISLDTTVKREKLIDEISEIINHNVNGLNIPESEICVLAPQWVHLASATRKLMANLPDLSFDGPGMAPFSRDIENFWFKISRIILTEPSPNLFLRRLRWSSEILKELEDVGASVKDLNSRNFLSLCNSIRIEETEGLKYLEISFDRIFSEIGLSIENYSVISDHYTSFFESSKKRLDRLEKEGVEGVDTIETFKKVFKQRNGITVSTFHGVKGTEFDTVIAYALLQDYIPHWTDENGEENSRKLLYVISSRARKNLYLIAERGRHKNYGNPPPEYKTTQHLIDYKYQYD